MAENGIVVYDSDGKFRERIKIPEAPTSFCFADPDRRTLFIMARPAIAQEDNRGNRKRGGHCNSDRASNCANGQKSQIRETYSRLRG
jgi:sugar lactone lactonase YvrE